VQVELSEKQFRRLVDLVYIGNWILNSHREFADRITEYDDVEKRILSHCKLAGMDSLVENTPFGPLPSRAFREGGIEEAIADYEDSVFFEMLSEELARRDMEVEGHSLQDMTEFNRRIDEYMEEFEANGVTNVVLEKL